MNPLERRIVALERRRRGHEPTAAEIIATLRRRPRNADEFFIWEQNLTDPERAAYAGVVKAELPKSEREKLNDEETNDAGRG